MWFETEPLLQQIEDGVVVALRDVDIHLEARAHPFETGNATAIAAYWAKAKADNPALYNGRVVLPVSAMVENGVLSGVSRPVDFATFLYWARSADGPGGIHLFANAVMVSRDNAILAGRMAADTANAGRIYCPAGTFEPQDFVDGRMDFGANTRREVMEETGLDLNDARHEAGYWLMRRGSMVLLFRRVYFDADADALARRMTAFIESQGEPEIDRAVILRAGETPDRLTAHMRALTDWHFKRGPDG